MNKNMIDKEFTNQTTELDNGWIETPNGIFTPNDEQGLSAYEVYENYLYNLNNPPMQQPTLEEKVQLQEDKIYFLEGENEKLKVEQEQQNEEILVNMLANTEMFEMILGMIPMTLSKDEKNTKNNGGNSMIEVYVTLIIKGVKTIEDVPLVIREQVIERLKQLEVPVK